METSSQGKSWTQIMKVCNTTHVADFRDLCPRLSLYIVMDQIPLEQHKQVCRGLVMDFVANISTCQDCFCPRLSWFMSVTFTETSWFHDLSSFVSATFIICFHNFPHGEVSAKVGVIELGLLQCIELYNLLVQLRATWTWYWSHCGCKCNSWVQ